MSDAPQHHSASPERQRKPLLVRCLKFSFVWSVVFVGAIALAIYLREQPLGGRTIRVLAVTGLGALTGGFAAYALADIIARYRKQRTARFAALTVFLSAGTYGMTALIYFFYYRAYFSQWHEPPFTTEFFIQSLVTFLVSFYLVMLWGLHGLMPTALLLLFGAAVWFVKSQEKLDRQD